MEDGGSHSSTARSAGKPCGDATAPAMAASVPDLNTDSGAERFTISLADITDGVKQVAGLLGTGQSAVGAEPAQRRQRLPDALKAGFHCARTHWIRGFMTFQLARRTRTVRLTVPM